MKSTDTYFNDASRMLVETTFISYEEKKKLAAEIGVDKESLGIDRIDQAILDKLWELELEVLRLMASGVRSMTLMDIAEDLRSGWLGLSSEAGSVEADFASDILTICSKNIESAAGLPAEIVRKIRESRKGFAIFALSAGHPVRVAGQSKGYVYGPVQTRDQQLSEGPGRQASEAPVYHRQDGIQYEDRDAGEIPVRKLHCPGRALRRHRCGSGVSQVHPVPGYEEELCQKKGEVCQEKEICAYIQQVCIRLPEIRYLEEDHGGGPEAYGPYDREQYN